MTRPVDGVPARESTDSGAAEQPPHINRQHFANLASEFIAATGERMRIGRAVRENTTDEFDELWRRYEMARARVDDATATCAFAIAATFGPGNWLERLTAQIEAEPLYVVPVGVWPCGERECLDHASGRDCGRRPFVAEDLGL